MSIIISEEELKKEGGLLLEELRDLIESYKDFLGQIFLRYFLKQLRK